jgi:hypothetical protein
MSDPNLLGAHAMGEASTPSRDERDPVVLVARGIKTAVAPSEGVTDVQATLLQAITEALEGRTIDYRHLAPLGPEELVEVLREHPDWDPHRIVHHMVLGELVLRPLPPDVALRVATYAKALGVDDQFVRVARRYAQGAYGLAWMDLHRSGFTEHMEQMELSALRSSVHFDDPLQRADADPEVAARWAAFEDFPDGTLGRRVWEMYDGRGFALPGTPEGASAFLAQHDFVHVLADYGTNLKGELEVFAFIGRADPDPKGFAWLATLVGLFETGYINDAGFFVKDVKDQSIRSGEMTGRLADAIRRGKVVCANEGRDLFTVDYHELAGRPVDEVKDMLHFSPKSTRANDERWPGTFDRDGMSIQQQRFADARQEERA